MKSTGSGEAMLKIDGFDEACLGVVDRCSGEPTLLYDPRKIINILINRDGMETNEALEYFEFNIRGAWVGEGTPWFLEWDIASFHSLEELLEGVGEW